MCIRNKKPPDKGGCLNCNKLCIMMIGILTSLDVVTQKVDVYQYL